MASPCKKSKGGTGAQKEYIRVCDAFVRTVGGVICPLQKAEESVRVLFKLQRELLQTVTQETAKRAGLRLGRMEWVPAADSDQLNDGNIFMECLAARGDDAFEKFKNHVTSELKKQFNVKNILIEKLETKRTIPQPLISERDFDMYKLKLCNEILFKAAGNDPEKELDAKAWDIKSQLEELKENRVKICILSQNGKGKSSFLNLLFWLTADTEEEYKENNKDIKLPKDIENDPTIKELKDEEIKILPQVIQDVVTKIRLHEKNENNKKHLKLFAEQFVHTLTCQDVEDKSLSEIKNYFTGGRPAFEPYVLPQKTRSKSYQSTTKCIIHLRYGPMYQMTVEYFSAADLQDQLFELKSLTEEGTSVINDATHSNRRKELYKNLKARIALLTGLINDDDDEDEKVKEVAQSWVSKEDIQLSRDVVKYAGSTEIYIGNGVNATSDRLALKARLKKLSTSQEKNDQEIQEYRTKIAAVEKIVVYLPSQILLGKEILEMPGTDTSDPMAIKFISSALDKVDVVFLLSEYSLTIDEQTVKELLADSAFFPQMLKEPSNYKLMLLTYPEKDREYQFGINDDGKMQILEEEEKEKRKEEIKTLGNMIKEKALLCTLDEKSIYISYILPVLHISIHSQEEEGACHAIIEKYKQFLKHTGVTKLMIELDTFAAKKPKESVLEIRGKLEELPKEANGKLDVEIAKSVVSMLLKRNLKGTLDDNLKRQNEDLVIKLNKSLKETLTKFLKNKISSLLKHSIPEAMQRWKDMEKNIPSTGIFSPFYNGKHPAYQVKIYDILFRGLVEDAKKDFRVLIEEIKVELDTYEKEAIKLLTTELDNLLKNRCDNQLQIRCDTQQVVERAVKQSLKDAMAWYIGNIKLPFKEKTLVKYFQQSQTMSLKNNMLKPELKSKDISEAKEIMKGRIEKCIVHVEGEFKSRLVATLHDVRFRSLSGKLKDRNGSYLRMWQILMGKIKSISKDTERNPEIDDIEKAIKLMSVNLRDIPE